MGRDKALLPDRDGRPFVARIARTLVAAGLNDIVVVTGGNHDDVHQALITDASLLRAKCRRNPEPDRGQLSSLWVGLDVAEEHGAEGVLVMLVDVPMVRAETVRHVVEAWHSSIELIARPAIGETHGHPVIFHRELFDALRTAPLDQGAKVVINAYQEDVLNVEVDDQGCLTDVDTPGDYTATRGLAR
jgi:molybdenum cofactor cytidylyltransferase